MTVESGVPARVASGFSPGTFDEERREYVVRDLDAHSWVEVFFPGYGWIPFDPTPARSRRSRPRPTGGCTAWPGA